MGEFDSSKTRVGPVFSDLYKRDPTGETWLGALLRLPRREGDVVDLPADPGRLEDHAWTPREKQLPAPKGLLRTLAERPDLLAHEGLATSSPEVRAKRELLLAGDTATREEALAALETYTSGRFWFAFEGPTSVDAYLETDRLVVLVEGKRREPAPTTHTTWMRVRHQLLRNLDAALDASEKPAVAFFIVEGLASDPKAVPEAWRRFASATVSQNALTFYGIVITMYYRDHRPPHFHAIYGEYEAQIAIETLEPLAGELPPRALRLVREWAEMHRAELEANWGRAEAREPLDTIEPLS